MGLIMRNDIPYGGKEAIDSQKNEVIIGDGNEWAKGSDFFTNVIVGYPGAVDTTYEPLSKEYTGVFYLRLSSLSTEGITIKSIKLTDKDNGEDDGEELINEENLGSLVSIEEDSSSSLSIECDSITAVSEPDSETYAITKGKKTCLLQTNSDDPKITVKKNPSDSTATNLTSLDIKFTFKLNKSKPKKITVTTEGQNGSYSVIDKNPWTTTDTLAKSSKDSGNSISFDTDKILFIQKRIGSKLTKNGINGESDSAVPTLVFGSQVTDANFKESITSLFLSKNATITGTDNGHLLLDGNSSVHFGDNSIVFSSDSSLTQFTGQARFLATAYSNTTFTGNANTTFTGNSRTVIGGDAGIYADGSTRFTLHDTAWLDVNQEANVKFGNKAKIFIEPKVSKSTPHIAFHAGHIIMNAGQLDSSPYTPVDESFDYNDWSGYRSPYFNGPIIEMSNSAALSMADSSFLKLTEKAVAMFADQSKTQIRDNATLTLDTDCSILLNGEEKLCPYIVGNTEQFIMAIRNGSSNFNLYAPDVKSNPYIQYPNLYSSTVLSSDTYFLSSIQTTQWPSNFPTSEHHLVSIVQGDNTEVIIGSDQTYASSGTQTGLTKIIAGAENGGQLIYDLTTKSNSIASIRYGADSNCKVHLDMGAGGGASSSLNSECYVRLHPEGKLYINANPPKDSTALIELQPNKNGKLAYLLQGDNVFIQHTGNFHAEFHDNSTIIMRGAESFYNNGANSQAPYPDKNNMRPWNDGEKWMGWRRPVLSKGKSPIIGMYDGSNFIMRGAWNTEIDLYNTEKKPKTFTFNVSNNWNLANESEDITYEKIKDDRDFQQAEKNLNCYITGGLTSSSDGNDKKFTVNKEALSNNKGWKITVKNFTYTTKPHDWTPHIPHTLYHPTLEVIENAEVRLGGFIYIKAGTYEKQNNNNNEPNLDKEFPFFNEQKLNNPNNLYAPPYTVKEKVITAITIGSNIPPNPSSKELSATNEKDEVTFTIEDLKKLKEIINKPEVLAALKQSS